jgi:hypothetical protein
MVNRGVRRATGVALAAVMLAGALTGCDLNLPAYGCTDRDEGLATILAGLSILSAPPPTATASDEMYSGCDSDDRFAYAGQEYRSDLDRQSVLVFYSQSATGDGWRTAETEGPLLTGPAPSQGLVTTAGVSCFNKEVDGIVVKLSVSFPSDLNIPGEPELQLPEDAFNVEVTGSHHGDRWC